MADSSFDNTSRVAAFLDRHLTVLLLEHLSEKKVYPADAIIEAKLQTLAKTMMTDSYTETYKQAKGIDPPQEYLQKRKEHVERMRQLQTEVQPFIKALLTANRGDAVSELINSKSFTMETLIARIPGVTETLPLSMYKYAKVHFEAGSYEYAAKFLNYYLLLETGRDDVARKRQASAKWGKLAVDILTQAWGEDGQNMDEVMADLKAVKEVTDQPGPNQLLQRCWFVNWSLFVYFNHKHGLDLIIDLFFEDRLGSYSPTSYCAAMQTASAHVLRYLVAAVVVNKRKQQLVLKQVLQIIQEEEQSYSDPVTQFLHNLLTEFDFEAALANLEQCQALMSKDYFLVGLADQFMTSARELVFEHYLRLHSVADISDVAAKLGMDETAAEGWIVNLIRKTGLDARIDTEARQIILDAHIPNVYDKVRAKTKNLSTRTSYLWQNIHSAVQKDRH